MPTSKSMWVIATKLIPEDAERVKNVMTPYEDVSTFVRNAVFKEVVSRESTSASKIDKYPNTAKLQPVLSPAALGKRPRPRPNGDTPLPNDRLEATFNLPGIDQE